MGVGTGKYIRTEKHRKLASEQQKIIQIGRKNRLGKKNSEEHRRKISLAEMGSKNWRWKGGITPLKRKIRGLFEYRQWRSDVYTRDKHLCQDCGIEGKKLHAHHIKQFSIILFENKITSIEEALNCEELWNTNNGKTLCIECHDKIPVLR